MRLFSVGHGTAAAEQLSTLLDSHGVRRVVDVRTAPGSRRHPQFARDALQEWLPAAGISYRWEPRLGGFRKPATDSPDVVWRNASFRGYAGHLRTPEARAALADLVADAAAADCAFMCSETVWWRCHRRLIADALVLLFDAEVIHVMPGGSSVHAPTPGVRVIAGQLFYDGGGDNPR